MNTLILASGSPRRAELLRQIGLDFQVIPSEAPEDLPPGLSPADAVKELALRKASEVARNISSGVIIGADTVVVAAGRILGKPSDKAEARTMLATLSGIEHSVFTGLAVLEVPNGKQMVDCVETKVWFRKLTQAEIDWYVASGEPLDKAGAYGIQGLGAILVEKIDGCYFNVVGLPLGKLVTIFQKMELSIAR
jgi:septum formation protein